jgi:hypothetical protein
VRAPRRPSALNRPTDEHGMDGRASGEISLLPVDTQRLIDTSGHQPVSSSGVGDERTGGSPSCSVRRRREGFFTERENKVVQIIDGCRPEKINGPSSS